MQFRLLITALFLMLSLAMSAQLRTGYQTDSVRNAEYRKKIAIDMSVPYFETTRLPLALCAPTECDCCR